jgi:hypothetical protein
LNAAVSCDAVSVDADAGALRVPVVRDAGLRLDAERWEGLAMVVSSAGQERIETPRARLACVAHSRSAAMADPLCSAPWMLRRTKGLLGVRVLRAVLVAVRFNGYVQASGVPHQNISAWPSMPRRFPIARTFMLLRAPEHHLKRWRQA